MRRMPRFLFWTALIVGAIVGIGRAIAIRWYRIPSDDVILAASLAPTLRGGDLILLWRLGDPKYGDLVLCPEPDAPDRIIIGRIIGEANDQVTIKGNNVEINGHAIPTERVCLESSFTIDDPNSGIEVQQGCQIETVGAVSHSRGTIGDQGQRPPDVQAEVPSGRVYLVSDNRLFPYDSRDYQSVDRSTCKESVVFRIVSKDGFMDADNRFSFIH